MEHATQCVCKCRLSTLTVGQPQYKHKVALLRKGRRARGKEGKKTLSACESRLQSLSQPDDLLSLHSDTALKNLTNNKMWYNTFVYKEDTQITIRISRMYRKAVWATRDATATASKKHTKRYINQQHTT